MFRKTVYCLIAIVVCGAFLVSSNLFAQAGDPALQAKVKEAIAALQQKTGIMGAARVSGTEALGAATVPVLYFGDTKINQNYEIVDALKATLGCTATLFVKDGTDFVRISTNVMKDDARAIGTKLAADGKAYAAISKGDSFFGTVDILGKQYETGYVPIKSATGDVIGIYYVGYLLAQ